MSNDAIGECHKFKAKVPGLDSNNIVVLARNAKEAKKLVVQVYGDVDFTLTQVPFSENSQRG